ncbi:MAG: DUF2202 domain-containing protein [Chitinophagaceae bacterium]|nr:DUF2202 domain-containing protein [Chitinophagaceae bacterium]
MKLGIVFSIIVLLVFITDKLPAQKQTLTVDEKEGILFMYEEEKLARDVYDSMFVKWEFNPFGHIRKSERMHMSEMKGLVKTYQLEDAVLKNQDKAGVFNNASLQALYNDLVAKGSLSSTDALRAGALIEEVDIRDLKERKAKAVQKDILEAYDFLIMGSENHLRAFCRNLKGAGVIYEPAVLSKADFDKIIKAENEMGGCNH